MYKKNAKTGRFEGSTKGGSANMLGAKITMTRPSGMSQKTVDKIMGQKQAAFRAGTYRRGR